MPNVRLGLIKCVSCRECTPVTNQVCTEESREECTTVGQLQCQTVDERVCEQVEARTDCRIISDRKCSLAYEKKCETTTVEECSEEEEGDADALPLYSLYTAPISTEASVSSHLCFNIISPTNLPCSPRRRLASRFQ